MNRIYACIPSHQYNQIFSLRVTLDSDKDLYWSLNIPYYLLLPCLLVSASHKIVKFIASFIIYWLY